MGGSWQREGGSGGAGTGPRVPAALPGACALAGHKCPSALVDKHLPPAWACILALCSWREPPTHHAPRPVLPILQFAAQLRLPTSIPAAQRAQIVEDVLTEMGLDVARNTYIG